MGDDQPCQQGGVMIRAAKTSGLINLGNKKKKKKRG